MMSDSFDVVDEEAISKELDELELAQGPATSALDLPVPSAAVAATASTILAPLRNRAGSLHPTSSSHNKSVLTDTVGAF